MSCNCIKPPSPDHKMYAVCHTHEYESSMYVIWSLVHPTEEQAVEALNLDYEPEKEERVDIEEISEIVELKLS